MSETSIENVYLNDKPHDTAKKPSREIWVYIETDRSGIPLDVGLELLGEGQRLARIRSCGLAGIVIGRDMSKAVDEARYYGADRLIVVEGKEYSEYSTDAYTAALYYLVKKYDPDVLMIGATSDGRDLAPRLAARLGTGLTADCTDIGINEEKGCIEWTRPAMAGNMLATIICPDHRPQMGTIRPGVFKKAKADKEAEIVRESFEVPGSEIRTELLEILRSAEDGCGLDNAEIIVSGGRGAGGAKGFELIRKLADILGGSVGASRAAVDEGMIGRSHQIGQTGKTVSPKLYIACGISGAIQHQAGMNNSDVIIAINSDPEAPIFRIADYGIVGDMFEIIPALTETLRTRAN